MKLLNRPKSVVTTVMMHYNGKPLAMPGRPELENVKILCQDETQNTKEEVWQRLQYGVVIDFTLGKKIPKLTFIEDDAKYTLYGIIPVSFERSLIWEGKIVECQYDYYEIEELQC